MGQPKLLLPWSAPCGETATVIDCVLRAWTSSCVDRVVVVVNPLDDELQSVCRRWNVDLAVLTSETEDMKASVQFGMQHLSKTYQPAVDDWCFLAPADLPTLATAVINHMVHAEKASQSIAVAVYGAKTSHPVLFPWATMQTIHHLAPHEGVDQLVSRSPTTKIVFPPTARPLDIDTPQEYAELKQQTAAQDRSLDPQSADERD